LGCNKEPKEFTPHLEELKGWIIEDIWIDKYEDWESHLQAIKHVNGDLSLRVYVYKKEKDGKKTPIPYSYCIYDWTIEDFREEIKKHKADIIKMLLRKISRVVSSNNFSS